MGKLKAISLFSGCGGSDLGAKLAGVDVVFVNDSNADAIATYKKYQKLLTSTGAEVRCCNVTSIKSFSSCDLLIGCYPCQSFTMGGHRSPNKDPRSNLFMEFNRCLTLSEPSFFITENVSGLAWLEDGAYLKKQIECFSAAGKGYHVSVELLNTKDFGIPQDRKRVIIVGVKKEIGLFYHFPKPTHGPNDTGLLPWTSHGDVISGLPLMPSGEFYHYELEPFSWWYLSRNRKRKWEEPSFSIQANWRHVSLHPASPTMHMVESNLKDGFKQRWEFTSEYDHLEGHPERPTLEKPRRLSWRECALIQTFPEDFEPSGSVYSKYRQIGNATPPLLMSILVNGISKETALRPDKYKTSARSLAGY